MILKHKSRTTKASITLVGLCSLMSATPALATTTSINLNAPISTASTENTVAVSDKRDNATLYAGNVSKNCPTIEGLELDKQSQYDVQQILDLPSRVKLLNFLTVGAAVLDVSSAAKNPIPLMITENSWHQWAEATGAIGKFARNRITTLAGVSAYRYSPTTDQGRKHQQFWTAIYEGCLFVD